MNEERPELRLAVLAVLVVALFAALFARLWFLQVVAAPEFEVQAQTNRIRYVQYPGSRGEIIDRNGEVIVGNRESIIVTLDRQRVSELNNPNDLYLRLARVLNDFGILTKVSDIESRLDDPRYDPFKPVPIAEDVSPGLELFLLERRQEFPAVDVERSEVRTYPNGELAAHILGYTGLINEDELADRTDRSKTYQGGDEIGKTGIERIYEDDLRGVPGVRSIEVDARGQDIAVRDNQVPKPGDTVQLTIDLELQRRVEQLLADAVLVARRQEKEIDDPPFNVPGGAAVVLDVRNGEVLAMASYPSFDPAEFVGGIRRTRFDELNDPASGFPLNNRAIQSGYAPGSTFKVITSYAALDAGVVAPEDVIIDEGRYQLENCDGRCVFRNAGNAEYGAVDLRSAITWSSDVYFYRLGETFWVDQNSFAAGGETLQEAARSFGFGSPTGVQLPFEDDGLVSDPDFKRQRNEDLPEVFREGRWFTGDSVNLAIGQGDLLATPLQLANAYASLANGGSVLAPSVVRQISDGDSGEVVRVVEPRVTATLDLPDDIRDPILEGLTGTVSFAGPPSGTAFRAFDGFPLDVFPVAGKTGTAEVFGKADSALFAAFAPADNPRYAVVAILEEAGFGSRAAAPLVRRIFEQLDPVRDLIPGTTPWDEIVLPPARSLPADASGDSSEIAAAQDATSVLGTSTTSPGATSTTAATTTTVQGTVAPATASTVPTTPSPTTPPAPATTVQTAPSTTSQPTTSVTQAAPTSTATTTQPLPTQPSTTQTSNGGG